MKRLLVVFTLLALSTLTFAKDKTWNGWISDAKCGSKVNAECAKKCIQQGNQAAVLVTDDSKQVVQIHNQDAVKEHAGHHVKVTGKQMADGSIHVDKVTMLPDQNMGDMGGK
jgi:hypothetical protein